MMGGVYDVCVLLEQPLAHQDAAALVALHAEAPEPTHYHLLLPSNDPGAQMEWTLASIASSEVVAAAPLIAALPEDLERLHEEALRRSAADLESSVAAITAAGGSADGEVVVDDPLERLTATVAARDSREVIVLTRPHLVAELFHTDWTHQARKHLGVPVLHLLAHRD
jgi:hypothetical protein